MPLVARRFIMANIHTEAIDRLFNTILNLETIDDCYSYFEDLCTIKELQDMAQRLSAAKMLKNGENYLNIASEIGISTATISRVNRCLKYGSDGYSRVLERLGEEDKENG